MRFLALLGLVVALAGHGGAALANGELNRSVRMEVRRETKEVPFHTRFEHSRTTPRGRIVRVREGQPGTVTRVYHRMLANGKLIGEKLVRTERSGPVDEVYLMGPGGLTASRGGGFVRVRTLEVTSTAYTPAAGRRRPTFRTATGTPARVGVVAVDPRVIPLGTLLYVEGYGFARAEDTGGAIKGKKIDVCVPDNRTARQWGRRTVRVHILR